MNEPESYVHTTLQRNIPIILPSNGARQDVFQSFDRTFTGGADEMMWEAMISRSILSKILATSFDDLLDGSDIVRNFERITDIRSNTNLYTDYSETIHIGFGYLPKQAIGPHTRSYKA